MTDLIGNTNAFGTSALFVGALAALSPRRREWWIIAASLAAMAIVIATGVHLRAHDKIQTILKDRSLYSDHVSIQLAIASVGALIGAGLAIWIICTQRRLHRWAALITLSLVGLIGVQALSIHDVDALLGRPLGPAMVIGWLWGGSASMITILAVITRQTSHRRQR